MKKPKIRNTNYKIKSMHKKYILCFLFLFFASFNIFSQEDSLENLLNSEMPKEINYATATFKATRIINGQSIERMPQGQLDFRIHHRFGTIDQGAYGFWGLDGATTHFSLEYGITNWVMVGIGRGNIEKTFDGFVKFSIFRQSSGIKNMPVSISLFSSIADMTEDFPYIDSIQNNSNYPYSSRIIYTHQILVARKFNNIFSLQLSPTFIHYNLVQTELDPNDVYAVGIGGRIKLTTRISLNAEYFYVIKPKNNYQSTNYINPFSIGFDIETGGHVFQLMLTNASGMIEEEFIGRTTDKWNKAGIHLGFNISRVFDINHKTNK